MKKTPSPKKQKQTYQEFIKAVQKLIDEGYHQLAQSMLDAYYSQET